MIPKLPAKLPVGAQVSAQQYNALVDALGYLLKMTAGPGITITSAPVPVISAKQQDSYIVGEITGSTWETDHYTYTWTRKLKTSIGFDGWTDMAASGTAYNLSESGTPIATGTPVKLWLTGGEYWFEATASSSTPDGTEITVITGITIDPNGNDGVVAQRATLTVIGVTAADDVLITDTNNAYN